MSKKLKHLASGIALSAFLFFAFGSFDTDTKNTCGCTVPNVTIMPNADSWDDKVENWTYKECATAESKEVVEKIHVYVFYNAKLDKYHCELLYSWPGNDCRMSSKLFGSNATSSAILPNSAYQSGEWKEYNYWLHRQN
mgnify:CR=1 FL=1